MGLLLAVLLFCGGLALIIKGGGILVDSAIGLGKITRMSTVFIGATFMAVATALPELFLSIFAVTSGNHGMATGNAIGGMIANMGLVLGLYLAFMPTRVNKKEVAFKNFFLMLTLLALFWVVRDLRVTWVEGVFLISGFALYLYISTKRESPRKSPLSTAEKESTATEIKELATTDKHRSLFSPSSKNFLGDSQEYSNLKRKTLLGFLFGQVLLIGGAFLLVKNGEHIAMILDLSETFIGFTLIAIGTSAPELTTVFTSIKRKKGDLALGNILGANIITATLLMGTLGILGGVPIGHQTLVVGLPILALVSMLAILPILIKGRTYRWQGVALLLIYTAYILYLGLLQMG